MQSAPSSTRSSYGIPRLIRNGLHLFALSAFAISQPLFDLLSQNPVFFVSHHSSALDVVLFALLVLALPACVAAAAEFVGFALIGDRTAYLHHLLLFAGFSAVFLPLLDKGLRIAPAFALPAAIALAGLATAAYAYSERLRAFATFLALAPPIFAGLFLAEPAIARLVFGGGAGATLDHPVSARSPVVLVVFDELPAHSLMNLDLSVDRRRFPAFGDLADYASWYPNATAVHTSTVGSIASIFTGTYPEPHRFPTLTDHPRNLFTLLESAYTMNVSESETMLYRGSDPASGDSSQTTLQRIHALASDARFIWLHHLIPAQWARGLPAVDRTWKNFADHSPERTFASKARQHIWLDYDDPQGRFEEFIDGIEPCADRCLHVIHSILPHQPWRLLPSGRRYSPDTTHGLVQKERWGDVDWEVAEGYQQHLLQVGAADRLLGNLIAKLRAAGLFEASVIAVTADHGASFWPGQSSRRLDAVEHPEDLVRVPLLVKLPHQRAGRVDTRRVEAVDLLPSLASAIDMRLPWPVDGCSFIEAEASCGDRPVINVYDQATVRRELPPGILERSDSLARKQRVFAAFDAGHSAVDWPFRLRPPRFAASWISRDVSTFDVVADSRFSAQLSRLPIDRATRMPATQSLARLTGHLRNQREPIAASADVHVVIALDGKIEAVVPAQRQTSSSYRFSSFVPEARLRAGVHQIGVYAVVDPTSNSALEFVHRERIELRPVEGTESRGSAGSTDRADAADAAKPERAQP